MWIQLLAARLDYHCSFQRLRGTFHVTRFLFFYNMVSRIDISTLFYYFSQGSDTAYNKTTMILSKAC